MVGIALVFGVMMIIPIGGADMPTVISLLNSYAGLSAAAMGFVLNSKLLIVAGALDGASGFILSVNMSKAMNRSFTNVSVRRIRTGAARSRRGRRNAQRAQCYSRRGSRDPLGRKQSRHRPRIRNGSRAGAAQSPRVV